MQSYAIYQGRFNEEVRSLQKFLKLLYPNKSYPNKPEQAFGSMCADLRSYTENFKVKTLKHRQMLDELNRYVQSFNIMAYMYSDLHVQEEKGNNYIFLPDQQTVDTIMDMNYKDVCLDDIDHPYDSAIWCLPKEASINGMADISILSSILPIAERDKYFEEAMNNLDLPCGFSPKKSKKLYNISMSYIDEKTDERTNRR